MCKYVWPFVATTDFFPNLWFVTIFRCRIHPFKGLIIKWTKSRDKHDKCDMTMFSVWHLLLFSPKFNSVKQSNLINKICNLTQSSKFVTKFYYKLFCFFLFGTAFFISIADLRNLFMSMFVLFRATFHLRGFLNILSNMNFLQYQIFHHKLTHLWPIFLFHALWKHKARGVQGVKKWEHLPGME